MTGSTLVRDLYERLEARREAPAFHWAGRDRSSAELLDLALDWGARFEAAGIGPGTVCALQADYTPDSCAALLALMRLSAIVAPLTLTTSSELPRLLRIGSIERHISLADNGVRIGPAFATGSNAVIERFRKLGHAGLIVFTSGSSGEPKGILHDLERVLKKFREARTAYRTLQFLLFDHFGGMNTLLATLSWGGVAVLPEERTPGAIARLIETARVELLPVTPTFLNLFLASDVHRGGDLSSVRLITYGTEVMPQETLERVRRAFPEARLQQTYGLSELGVLGSRFRDSASLWVRVGGHGFETKVIDGTPPIRSDYAMVGYLNAPDPFVEDGWMDTGDSVIQDGEWLRILGRRTEIINVGGRKMFPAEVEEVLLQADNVADALVHPEPHPLVGSVVAARVRLYRSEDAVGLRERLRAFCLARLAAYKVPVTVEATTGDLHSERYKKDRAALR